MRIFCNLLTLQWMPLFCTVIRSTESTNFLWKRKKILFPWNFLQSYPTPNLWFFQYLEPLLWVGMMMWICWTSKLKLALRTLFCSTKKTSLREFSTGKEIFCISAIVSVLGSINRKTPSSLTKALTAFIIRRLWQSWGLKSSLYGGLSRKKMGTSACWLWKGGSKAVDIWTRPKIKRWLWNTWKNWQTLAAFSNWFPLATNLKTTTFSKKIGKYSYSETRNRRKKHWKLSKRLRVPKNL